MGSDGMYVWRRGAAEANESNSSGVTITGPQVLKSISVRFSNCAKGVTIGDVSGLTCAIVFLLNDGLFVCRES